MRVIAKILIGVVVTIAAPIGALEAYGQWEYYRFERASPLAAQSRNTAEFRQRIQERFPIGMPQNELVDTLAAQGFRLEQGYTHPAADRANAQPERYRYLHLTTMGKIIDICRSDWSVSWQADANGALSEVDADYFFTCP